MKYLFLIVLISLTNICYSKNFYTWTDENGVKQFSQTPPKNSQQSNVKKQQLESTKNTSSSNNYSHTNNSSKSHYSRTNKQCKGSIDPATIRNINHNYEYGLRICKSTFKRGSKRYNICVKEYKDTRDNSLKKYKRSKQC